MSEDQTQESAAKVYEKLTEDENTSREFTKNFNKLSGGK